MHFQSYIIAMTLELGLSPMSLQRAQRTAEYHPTSDSDPTSREEDSMAEKADPTRGEKERLGLCLDADHLDDLRYYRGHSLAAKSTLFTR